MSASAPIACRLGLTATPERADGQEVLLASLIGPIVYRKEIRSAGRRLPGGYRTERLYVELTPDEQEAYARARPVQAVLRRPRHQHG
ncbi:MAG: hypothetical protein U0736_21630 [Gemmataceae bacterium]